MRSSPASGCGVCACGEREFSVGMELLPAMRPRTRRTLRRQRTPALDSSGSGRAQSPRPFPCSPISRAGDCKRPAHQRMRLDAWRRRAGDGPEDVREIRQQFQPIGFRGLAATWPPRRCRDVEGNRRNQVWVYRDWWWRRKCYAEQHDEQCGTSSQHCVFSFSQPLQFPTRWVLTRPVPALVVQLHVVCRSLTRKDWVASRV
jgi:hypothetical protein